jgi:hypothetical protein
MKTITRDELIDLLAAKPPSAELADGSSIEISMNQAIDWFNDKKKRSAEGWVWERAHYTVIGVEHDLEDNLALTIHQIGGTQ